MDKSDLGKQHTTPTGALVVPLEFNWFGSVKCDVLEVGNIDFPMVASGDTRFYAGCELTLFEGE